MQPNYDGYDAELFYASKELMRVKAQRDELLTACEAMLEAISDQGLDWFNTPILAEIEQMQVAIAAAKQPEIDTPR